MPGRTNTLHYLIYGLLLATLVALVVWLETTIPGLRRRLLMENGLTENISAAGYGFAMLLLVLLHRQFNRFPHILLILLFFGLRELDCHNRFTTMPITQSEFYITPGVPFWEKIIAIAFILIFLYCLLRIIIDHCRHFLAGIKHGNPGMVGIGISLVLLLPPS
ncbi:MAG: hypothetical protein SWH68_11950 [Thermodesulfobacteriota bacterium]|nr:hypothetical protein [Thermodesulfobacteriota bacterium]